MPLPSQLGPTSPTNRRWITENLVAITLLGLQHVPAYRVHPQVTRSLSTTLTLTITTFTPTSKDKSTQTSCDPNKHQSTKLL